LSVIQFLPAARVQADEDGADLFHRLYTAFGGIAAGRVRIMVNIRIYTRRFFFISVTPFKRDSNLFCPHYSTAISL